jgi:hypothetical protein
MKLTIHPIYQDWKLGPYKKKEGINLLKGSKSNIKNISN